LFRNSWTLESSVHMRTFATVSVTAIRNRSLSWPFRSTPPSLPPMRARRRGQGSNHATGPPTRSPLVRPSFSSQSLTPQGDRGSLARVEFTAFPRMARRLLAFSLRGLTPAKGTPWDVATSSPASGASWTLIAAKHGKSVAEFVKDENCHPRTIYRVRLYAPRPMPSAIGGETRVPTFSSLFARPERSSNLNPWTQNILLKKVGRLDLPCQYRHVWWERSGSGRAPAVASRAEAWIETIRADLCKSASHSVASRVAKKEAGDKGPKASRNLLRLTGRRRYVLSPRREESGCILRGSLRGDWCARIPPAGSRC
jgi:hypothetical protein